MMNQRIVSMTMFVTDRKIDPAAQILLFGSEKPERAEGYFTPLSDSTLFL